MPLHLHIDRLILNDIDLSPRERRILQAAIEERLVQLFSEHPGALQQDHYLASVAIAPLTADPQSTPTQLGQHIAQHIYQSISNMNSG